MIAQFLLPQIFAFFMIFCRIGAGIMLLPGFGETYVSPQIRLTLALLIALVLTPALGPHMPAVPTSPMSFALLVAAEIVIGVFIGSFCNILISVTHIAGMIMSLQSGMSSAVIFDATQNSQGSLIGNFLGLMTLVLIFTTDLHHLLLRGITESYVVFAPGRFPPMHDFVDATARIVSQCFVMAVQISAPLIVSATLLFLGGGVLSRLMPTMQVFFVIVPPQLVLGFFMLVTSFSAVMLWYMDFYRDSFVGVFGYLK